MTKDELLKWAAKLIMAELMDFLGRGKEST